ncbi:MAG: GTPase HflX [Phototrophicales bacterium]|nr:MAG: GTPase HflX [Phototrophicales bacterium]
MTPNIETNNKQQERAYLVGVEIKGTRSLLSINDSLSELGLLAQTADLEVVGQTVQRLDKINPATYIGSGKAEEISLAIEELDVQVIIFDDELSPRHQRELEKCFGKNIKVLDRSVLILDIFAKNARTREGALQVELAQYEYRLPRLTRQWTHLARQTGGGAARGGIGGVGLRGPGETQLEVDRREISRKITRLKSDLELVRLHREQYRARRTQAGISVVALVGYTNAGKSTLLHVLTNSDVYIADELFATLDPTTRRLTLPSGRNVLLTDTVGFIQKLPTTLIAAFRATLEEIAYADLILHVVDASHPNALQHVETVEDTLAEIDIPSIPRILVWNKIDRLQHDDIFLSPSDYSETNYIADVSLSAINGVGLDELKEMIDVALAGKLKQVKLLLPYKRGDLLSLLHEQAMVENQEFCEDGVVLTVRLPHYLSKQFKAYQLTG